MTDRVKKIGLFSSLMKIVTVISLISLVLSYLSPLVHPETVEILPFFGLVYPVIILVVLLLLIYWSFRKSRWALVILGFVVLGGNLHFRTFAFTLSEYEAPEDATKWKIMS